VPSYTASKSGLAGLTKASYFVTNNTEALRTDQTRSRQIMERIPADRWGTPHDLAGVAVFLASRASDHMHGAIVPVDGGWLPR
jgi:2-deoxy-D-gluconate 3-dehydrogenase